MIFNLSKLKLLAAWFFLLMMTSVYSSEKNITYMQILQNPNDLDLNIKYAQQQGKMGNFKQTISTLERMNMLYPDNTEIKLYLLSVLVQVDSPEKYCVSGSGRWADGPVSTPSAVQLRMAMLSAIALCMMFTPAYLALR